MIVLIGGKFNRIHDGHRWLLTKAKAMGFLVVVVAHDSHNTRPYARSAAERKAALEATGLPDKVVIGDADEFSNVLDAELPDVIVLGYDQQLPPGTAEKVRDRGIPIVRFEKHGDFNSRDTH